MRDSLTVRVPPRMAPEDRSRVSACGSPASPDCRARKPYPAHLRGREATTSESGPAPRATADCRGLWPELLSEADSTVGKVPAHGLGPCGAGTSSIRYWILLQSWVPRTHGREQSSP